MRGATIKRILALALGIYSLLYTNDIMWMIFGGILLIWAIVNILGDKYYTFEIISNIFDIIIGLSFIVLGLIITIPALDWTTLILSSVFGVLILLQGLLPIIAKIRSKRTIANIKENSY